MNINSASHFHIRWIIAGTSHLDWEAFVSHDEAERTAGRFIARVQTYVIEEFDESCERCAMFRLAQKVQTGVGKAYAANT